MEKKCYPILELSSQSFKWESHCCRWAIYLFPQIHGSSSHKFWTNTENLYGVL